MMSYDGFCHGQRVAHGRRYGVITGILERDGGIVFVVRLDRVRRPRQYRSAELRAVRVRRSLRKEN